MMKANMQQLTLFVCFLLLFLFIRVSYSMEPVVIEFLYYEPCPTCPSEQEQYKIYLHNSQVVQDIQGDYGSKVSVKQIYFYSEEGLEKINQYSIDLTDWNTIVLNYEAVILGYANETRVREIIDSYLTPVHDVAILGVLPASSNVYIGDSVDINVTVKNEGTEAESFNVTLYYNSSVIETRFIENLEPAKKDVLVFHWETQNVTEGYYIISALADVVQNETDIDDNWLDDGIVEVRGSSIPPTIRHNVGIIKVEPSHTTVEIGEKLNFTVTVRNLGTETESFNVGIYCNETLVGSLTVTGLSPNHIVPMIFVWDTINQAPGSYTIKAQAEQVANETNFDDNVYIYDGKIEVVQSSSSDSLTLIPTLALAFSFGFFETFSPCLIIMLSFISSYTIGEEPSFKGSFLKVMIFGISFVFAAVLLGVSFGLFFLSMPTLQFSLIWIACIFALIFGLNLLGLLKAPFQTKPLIKELSRKYVTTYAGLFILGFIFYFLNPCTAPILVSMVPLLLSDLLPLILFVFSIGAIIPFITIGIFAGSVSKLARSAYRQRFKIRAISGLILISYALYLIIFYLLPRLIR